MFQAKSSKAFWPETLVANLGSERVGLNWSGAISADGHHWLNEAFADDYDERAMDTYPRSYPCCGSDLLSFAGTKFFWQAVAV